MIASTAIAMKIQKRPTMGPGVSFQSIRHKAGSVYADETDPLPAVAVVAQLKLTHYQR